MPSEELINHFLPCDIVQVHLTRFFTQHVIEAEAWVSLARAKRASTMTRQRGRVDIDPHLARVRRMDDRALEPGRNRRIMVRRSNAQNYINQQVRLA